MNCVVDPVLLTCHGLWSHDFCDLDVTWGNSYPMTARFNYKYDMVVTLLVWGRCEWHQVQNGKKWWNQHISQRKSNQGWGMGWGEGCILKYVLLHPWPMLFWLHRRKRPHTEQWSFSHSFKGHITTLYIKLVHREFRSYFCCWTCIICSNKWGIILLNQIGNYKPRKIYWKFLCV